MYVATQPSANYNGTGAVNVGELWVSYDVEFYRPRITPARFGYFHCKATSAAAGTPVYTANSSIVYGTMTGASVNQGGGTLTITFPNADVGDVYQVIVSGRTAAAGSWASAPAIGHTGVNDLAILGAGPTATYGGTYSSAVGPLTGNYCLDQDTVVISDAIPTISVTVPATLVTGGCIDIQVIDLGNGFTSTTL